MFARMGPAGAGQKRQTTLLDAFRAAKRPRTEGGGRRPAEAEAATPPHRQRSGLAAAGASTPEPSAPARQRQRSPEAGKARGAETEAAGRPEGRPPPKRDDWFSQLFGFSEDGGYAETKRWLRLLPPSGPGQPDVLESLVTGQKFGCGRFSSPTLAELRALGAAVQLPGRLRVTNELGDVGAKHALQENRHAVFQAASQFNCLEFVGPSVRPEDGVARYAMDRTQGPCCAIACGAGTVFRNYFVPLDASGLVATEGQSIAQHGQTERLQLQNLADIGSLLGNGAPKGRLYEVKGGYTLANGQQLARLRESMRQVGDLDAARSQMRVGVHSDVQVTSLKWGREQLRDAEQTVTQVYGSACSVAYNRASSAADWEDFSRLVLEASYEATLWAAVLTADQHRTEGSRRVFLTCLGGGVFGNRMEWIVAAMDRAFTRFQNCDLDVRIVTYAGAIDPYLQALETKFGGCSRKRKAQ